MQIRPPRAQRGKGNRREKQIWFPRQKPRPPPPHGEGESQTGACLWGRARSATEVGSGGRAARAFSRPQHVSVHFKSRERTRPHVARSEKHGQKLCRKVKASAGPGALGQGASPAGAAPSDVSRVPLPRAIIFTQVREWGSPACPDSGTEGALSVFPATHTDFQATSSKGAGSGVCAGAPDAASLRPLVSRAGGHMPQVARPPPPAPAAPEEGGQQPGPCLTPTAGKGEDGRSAGAAGTGRKRAPSSPGAAPAPLPPCGLRSVPESEVRPGARDSAAPACARDPDRVPRSPPLAAPAGVPEPNPGRAKFLRAGIPLPAHPDSVPAPPSPNPGRAGFPGAAIALPDRALRARGADAGARPETKAAAARDPPPCTWVSSGAVPRGDGAAAWAPSSARAGRPPGSRPPQGPLEAAKGNRAARAGPAGHLASPP